MFKCGSKETFTGSPVLFASRTLSIQQRKIIIVKSKHVFLMLEIQLHRKGLKKKAFKADRERKWNLFYI